jgi:putrescine transport system permease protein
MKRARVNNTSPSWAVMGLPWLWLALFFMVPFALVLKLSFSETDGVAIKNLMSFKDGVWTLAFKVGHYAALVQDDLYFSTYLASLKYAAITALLCLVLGYPFAYFLARSDARVQPVLVMLVMLPFWTSFLLRAYAWKNLLNPGGWVASLVSYAELDQAFVALNWIAASGQLMNTPFSLVLGMTYTYLPFMILPLYANLVKMDGRLLEAAGDLGASPWVAFWRITVPLSKAGIVAGCMLVFIPCVGEYVIPELLGGPETQMIGRTLWDEFFSNNDWPMACAVAVAMVLLILLPLAVFNKYQAESSAKQP